MLPLGIIVKEKGKVAYRREANLESEDGSAGGGSRIEIDDLPDRLASHLNRHAAELREPMNHRMFIPRRRSIQTWGAVWWMAVRGT